MNQIKTVSDMMTQLQEEIEQVKTGGIDESKARVIARFRGLQLKTAELNLQFNRLLKGRALKEEMPLLIGGDNGQKEGI